MQIFSDILFFVLYFAGLLAFFLLGAKMSFDYRKKKETYDFCVDDKHAYFPDGSPVTDFYCIKCHKKMVR